MKRRRLPYDQRLKRRYNLCHRLRLKGVEITTDANAIEITEEQYAALGKTARRYCNELCQDFHYVIQLRVPDGRGGRDEMPEIPTPPSVLSGIPAAPPRRRRKRPN